MKRILNRGIVTLNFLLCMYPGTGSGQSYSPATNYQTVNSFHDDTLMKQRWWIELDLLLNPIYVSQFSSKYYLNGHRLPAHAAPRFYGVLPSQVPFSDLGETADQANAIYFNFRIKAFDKSKFRLLHNTRAMIGITHDKLETGVPSIYYKYPDGGTELTLLLDKNISKRLSDLDFSLVNLIFNINVQAGLFASVAGVKANMSWTDTIIKSVSDARWQWPNPRSGWGWITSANIEIGGVLCHSYFISPKFTANTRLGKILFSVFRHIGFTVGTRAMFEGLYSSTAVTLNNVTGYRLSVHNYGLFVTGPVINIKYINF